MNFSISTWNYLCSCSEKANFNKTVAEIKDDGFSLELWLDWWPDMHLFKRPHWTALKKIVSGFSVISLHSALFGGREYDFSDLRTELDLSEFLGAKILVVHTDTLKLNGVPKDKIQYPGGTVSLYKQISKAVKYGEAKGVALALENGSLDNLKKTVDDCGIKVCLDFGHAHINPDSSIYDFLDEFSEKIIHLHFSDNDGCSDQHLVPGQGNISWQAVMASIKKINFSGQCVLELNTNNARQSAVKAREFISSFNHR